MTVTSHMERVKCGFDSHPYSERIWVAQPAEAPTVSVVVLISDLTRMAPVF